MMQYRPEVDGLRAIAVSAVLGYHLGIPFFSGGFVGVDVFFVISGYLMTTRIASDIISQNFNYRVYMGRRIRRLLPALATVAFITCLIAILLFPPSEIRSVLRSAIYSFLGISNFRFWAQSGYFDEAAITKPLLHTWSLAVEFQFYVLFPFVIMAFLKLTRSGHRWTVGGFFLLFWLVVSIAWLRFDPSGAYLLMPARVFEFGVGAVVAQFVKQEKSQAAVSVCALAGLAMIGVCVIWYDEAMQFPGIAALVPTVGAGLVLYGSGATRVAPAMGSWPLRQLGKISYSIYLVHWPIIVFSTFWLDNLFASDKVLVIVATLALSILLFHAIEQPFRSYSPSSHRKIIARGSFATMLSATIFFLAIGDSAWTWRYQTQLLSFIDPNLKKPAQEATWSLIKDVNRPFSDEKVAKVLIVGDSQAGDFTNVIQAAYGSSVEVRSIIRPSPCQVAASPAYYRDLAPTFEAECSALAADLLSDPRVAQADTIVLAFNWYLESAAFIDADAAELKSRGASRVFVIGPKLIGTDPMKLAAKQGSMKNLGEQVWRRIPQRLFQTNEALLASANNFQYLNLLDVVCPAKSARCTVIASDGTPVFYDHLHFTLSGASLVSKARAISDMHLNDKKMSIAIR